MVAALRASARQIVALGSIFYDLGDDKAAERVGLFAFVGSARS